MVVFLLKICIKDDCKNDNGVPNCMVVVTLMFSTCLPPLFHFASMSLQKLVSTLKGGSEKSAEKSVFFFFYSTSSFLFLFSTIVVFFFGDGVFSPLSLSNSSKFYSLKKHACNEEASLQCYLNIVCTISIAIANTVVTTNSMHLVLMHVCIQLRRKLEVTFH